MSNSNKPKFTPGPWVVRGETVNANRVHPVAPNQYNEEPIMSLARSPEERKANAALIAAAPGMLEALEYIKFSLNTFGSSDPDAVSVLRKLESAIAKATGGES